MQSPTLARCSSNVQFSIVQPLPKTCEFLEMKCVRISLSCACLDGSPVICLDNARNRQLPSGLAGSSCQPCAVRNAFICVLFSCNWVLTSSEWDSVDESVDNCVDEVSVCHYHACKMYSYTVPV